MNFKPVFFRFFWPPILCSPTEVIFFEISLSVLIHFLLVNRFLPLCHCHLVNLYLDFPHPISLKQQHVHFHGQISFERFADTIFMSIAPLVSLISAHSIPVVKWTIVSSPLPPVCNSTWSHTDVSSHKFSSLQICFTKPCSSPTMFLLSLISLQVSNSHNGSLLIFERSSIFSICISVTVFVLHVLCAPVFFLPCSVCPSLCSPCFLYAGLCFLCPLTIWSSNGQRENCWYDLHRQCTLRQHLCLPQDSH